MNALSWIERLVTLDLNRIPAHIAIIMDGTAASPSATPTANVRPSWVLKPLAYCQRSVVDGCPLSDCFGFKIKTGPDLSRKLGF